MKILEKLSKYKATKEEIIEVEQAIAKRGYWQKHTEWRISTTMKLRIQRKKIKDKTWFITTVKCENEVMIPAATIERAIIFMNIYRDFQMELFYSQGWASYESNKTRK